jgi:hypothetical protein
LDFGDYHDRDHARVAIIVTMHCLKTGRMTLLIAFIYYEAVKGSEVE